MRIKEVSKLYDITPDTLRYYEKVGIIPRVPRDESGIRNYDEKSCEWIAMMICLRKANVEISTLVEYVAMVQQGDKTLDERCNMLIEERKKQIQHIDELQKSLEFLDAKIAKYKNGEMVRGF